MVESVTLRPHEHAKLGIVHVGVTRQGFVASRARCTTLEAVSGP